MSQKNLDVEKSIFHDFHWYITEVLSRAKNHIIIIFLVVSISVAKEDYPAKFSKEELRSRLSNEQYHVTQEKGTERY